MGRVLAFTSTGRGPSRLAGGFLFVLLLISSPGAVCADEVTLVLTGDLYLGSWVGPYIDGEGPAGEGHGEGEGSIGADEGVDGGADVFGPGYPFGPTLEVLEGADVTIGNLESPLTSLSDSRDVFMEKQFVLRAPPWAVNALRSGSFDVLTLANNHMMDYGPRGLSETRRVLEAGGILSAGAGSDLSEARRPAIYHVGSDNVGPDSGAGATGVRVAVLAYSNTFPKEFYAGKARPGTAPGYLRYVKKDVRRAAEAADIVVVAFHWGAERMTVPKEYQVRLGRAAIDSGADLVVGHHPHVVQPVEVYKDRLIFYSLGNFVFGSYSPKEVEGAIARVVFSSDHFGSADSPDLGSGEASSGGVGYLVSSAEIIPLDVVNQRVHFRPVPLAGKRAKLFQEELENRSRALSQWGQGGSLAFKMLFGPSEPGEPSKNDEGKALVQVLEPPGSLAPPTAVP